MGFFIYQKYSVAGILFMALFTAMAFSGRAQDLFVSFDYDQGVTNYFCPEVNGITIYKTKHIGNNVPEYSLHLFMITEGSAKKHKVVIKLADGTVMEDDNAIVNSNHKYKEVYYTIPPEYVDRFLHNDIVAVAVNDVNRNLITEDRKMLTIYLKLLNHIGWQEN